MRFGGKRPLKFVLAVFALCVAALRLTTPAFAADSDQPATNPALEKAIHDYILAHPEVLIESLRLAKNREQQESLDTAKSTITVFKKELLNNPSTPVLGNPNGDVTVVEFFDYRCPYCRQVDPSLRSLLKEDAGLRIVQKELPILGPDSVLAARAALAANLQGKFPQFHEALMAKRPNFNEASIMELAQSLGLDTDRLKTDMAGASVNNEITHTIRLAKALGLNGTPAFVVGSTLIPGATDLQTLKNLIADTRQQSKN